MFLNGPEWKKQRKIANPAFHRSMPIHLFGTLTQKMFKTMDQMDSTIEITKLMKRWSLDALGKAGFGFDFKFIEDINNEWQRHTFPQQCAVQLLPKAGPKAAMLFPKRQKAHKDLSRFLNMLDSIIVSKRQDLNNNVSNESLQENEKDLLTLMIEGEQVGDGALTDEELKSNLCAFFVAGHDTTAYALAFAIYYLAVNQVKKKKGLSKLNYCNQDLQEKARKEAIHILGNEPVDVLPTVEQTKQMEYINMVIKEHMRPNIQRGVILWQTLRINDPASTTFPRKVCKDTEVAGILIPEGTLMLVDIYNLHRSPQVWTNPEKFDPQRFAPGGEAEKMAGGNMAWIPFASGGRQCIGMNFSLAEQRVMLSMLCK
ncbi:cytochrome P450-dit2 [Apophysomyces sp. BC1034]|nr:cytochrome P450-dit2 [Apophysomyces sp. BC1034]